MFLEAEQKWCRSNKIHNIFINNIPSFPFLLLADINFHDNFLRHYKIAICCQLNWVWAIEVTFRSSSRNSRGICEFPLISCFEWHQSKRGDAECVQRKRRNFFFRSRRGIGLRKFYFKCTVPIVWLISTGTSLQFHFVQLRLICIFSSRCS